MKTIEQNQQLELILTFLGISFIDYKGNRTSNGHRTAKTSGEIKNFFGKEVMTSGQFIEDIHWWNFQNDWNDLMFLIDKIKEVWEEPEELDNLKDALWWDNKRGVYEMAVDLIKEYNKK